ncbi:hypothetical protein IQ241_21410 [Romeria aff. gracilis LEGE 07310]|uniref:Uncharacterized protein n=1 Tax=Vasconcelosia minhoensis LEGE 07310 TaxID=915328 RepID=A0A8J7DPK0_9CYAN|nr:hypothetical protein [Romeria gracilis]MBE9079820.1 hypothetical protein [Romeria aff. gracilis LEGE 07310]
MANFTNKYVVGGVIFGILLLVIYGARASNRFAGWVDGDEVRTAESGSGRFVSSDSSQSAGRSADGETRIVQQPSADLSPLEQAGELPQRQTSQVQTADSSDNFTDTTVPTLAQDSTNLSNQPDASEVNDAADTLEPEPAATPQPAVRALW